MTQIDTVPAHYLECGDTIKVFSESHGREVYETIVNLEDGHEDDDTLMITVYTDDNPDDGYTFRWDADVALYIEE